MVRHALFALLLLSSTAAAAQAQGVRDVSYGPKSIVSVATKVRFTTLIVLPEGEEILDFVCGDKDLWVISGAQNLAYVKPAKSAIATNLNLVTATGQVYSFVLTESNGDPDLKIYVQRDGVLNRQTPRFHSSAEVEALRASLADATRQVADARQAAAQAVEDAATAKLAAEKAAEGQFASFRATYPTQLKFPYRFRPSERPFSVTAIFHDDRFTYIRSDAAELPALYEILDGGPNLISFQVQDGVYIVPKVLERGYLKLGKQEFRFEVRR